jgi:hypothetical protein
VRDLRIISPHGHTNPRWLAENKPFPNPTVLFLQPDHYIFRMFYSQRMGLGIPELGGRTSEVDPKAAAAVCRALLSVSRDADADAVVSRVFRTFSLKPDVEGTERRFPCSGDNEHICCTSQAGYEGDRGKPILLSCGAVVSLGK